MKTLKFSGTIILIATLICGCSPLQLVTTIRGDVKNYEYVFIPSTEETDELTESTDIRGIGEGAIPIAQSLVPGEFLTRRLKRAGFTVLPELNPDLADQTLIITYTDKATGRRRWDGRVQEVEIRFISAKTNAVVYSGMAEGSGSTKVNGLKNAIRRSLRLALRKNASFR